MKVLFPNGATAHLEKSVADGLIAGGICVAAPDAPGTPKQPGEPGCELIWTVGHTQHSNLPCVTARCEACRATHHYTIDPLEPRRERNGGGVARFAVFHRGRRETIPQFALEQVRALGIPNAETLGHGTPPTEFLQSSGDLWRDLQTVTNGHRPADPTEGPVSHEITLAKGKG